MTVTEPLLECAYTGELLTIERIDGAPLFRCTGGFSPAKWVSGALYSELRKSLLRRPGGRSVRKLVCPYKGTEIRIVEHMGLIRAMGAFDPAECAWESRREAEWEVSWREGKPPAFERRIRIVVGEPTYPESDPMTGYGSTTGKIQERVEKALST